MRKRILIFSHALEIGGAERALLGLLENIDTERYEVDLFLMRHEGELLPLLPSGIHLLPQIRQYSDMAIPVEIVIKRCDFGVLYGRTKGKLLARHKVKELRYHGDNGVGLEYSHKYTLPYMPYVTDKEYDIAISFLTPHYYTAHRVHARRKIAWIHTDYSTLPIDIESEYDMWSQYDHIVAISEDCRNAFLNIFPSLESKVCVIKNIMAASLIDRQRYMIPDVFSSYETGSIILLTVGRFVHQKNMDNIPNICRRIVEKGADIRWYLIGDGNGETLIRERIKKEGMEQRVIILGPKTNPYPYMDQCDLYVQPSRYEGHSVAVREAQYLHKPVVITEYATAASQLDHNVDGIIVPMDNEGCAEGIFRLLNDKALMTRLQNECARRDYTNKREIEKIYNLFSLCACE